MIGKTSPKWVKFRWIRHFNAPFTGNDDKANQLEISNYRLDQSLSDPVANNPARFEAIEQAALLGRNTRVAHFEQPYFAWK